MHREKSVEITFGEFQPSDVFHNSWEVLNSTGRIKPSPSQSFRKITCSRHAKTVFGVKTPRKHKLPNTWYFQKSLSVTNCVWISWVNLSSFYVNRCKTDRDIYNSLKTFQNRKNFVAPSVPTLAVTRKTRMRSRVIWHIRKNRLKQRSEYSVRRTDSTILLRCRI
jgi:hypothetical protein